MISKILASPKNNKVVGTNEVEAMQHLANIPFEGNNTESAIDET